MNASRYTLLLTTFACLWGYQLHAMEENTDSASTTKAATLIVAAAAKTALGVPNDDGFKKVVNKRKSKKRRAKKKTYAQATLAKIKVAAPKDPITATRVEDIQDTSIEPEEITDEYTALKSWKETEDPEGIASLPIYSTNIFYNENKRKVKILEQDPNEEEGVLRLRKNIEKETFYDKDGNKVKLFDKDGNPEKHLYKMKTYKRPTFNSTAIEPVHLKWKKTTALAKEGWMNQDDLDQLLEENGGRIISKLNSETNDIDYYVFSWVATEVEKEEACHINAPYKNVTNAYGKVTKNRSELKLAESIAAARKNAIATNKARIEAEKRFKAAEQKYDDLILGADSQSKKAQVLLELFKTQICPAISEQHEEIRSDLVSKGTAKADTIKRDTTKDANALLAEKEQLENEQTQNEESLANIEAVLPQEEQKSTSWLW